VRPGSHTFQNVPIQLFGGAGTGLTGGRIARFGGRSTNDLWLSIARRFGVDLPSFGDDDRCDGSLRGLFSSDRVTPDQGAGAEPTSSQ
jgi:hypothetical protein